jgi:uncharacterized membrane protein
MVLGCFGDFGLKAKVAGGSRVLIDEEVMAVVLAVIIVVAIFAGSQLFFAGGVVEPFSELAILGPEMKIGDYPGEVVAEEAFTLYLHVGNHEGRVLYYAVMIKLGNQTTPVSSEEPMPVPVLSKYEVILLHGGNWTKPITLNVTQPGVNYRLVFELWVYDEAVRSFSYVGHWCQLWLNVTGS